MSHNSNDVSLIFEKPPDLRCNVLTDEKLKVNVPDLSVFSEIASDNGNAECRWKSTITKTKHCKSSAQQETFLSPTPYRNSFDNKVELQGLKNQVLHKSNYCSPRCELSNGLPLQSQAYLETESLQNGTKSNKLVTVKIPFNNFSTNLPERKDYSSFSNNVMELLRQQDKKFADLQNQISLFLQQKDFSVQDQIRLEKESISDFKTSNSEYSKKIPVQNNHKVGELLDQNLILMYIKEHSDQISKLQDQIDLLLKQTEKLESFYSRTEKLDQIDILLKRTEKLESLYLAKEKEACNNGRLTSPSKSSCLISKDDDISSILEDQSYEPGQNEVVYHEEKKVQKTSTSTMTSLTFQGNNDKLVFHKMLTVVTDVSNCQKDVSIQCPQEIHTTAAETKIVRTKSGSLEKGVQITSKSVDLKKHKRKSFKSPKKSLNKNRKSNKEQVCLKTQEAESPPSTYSSATLPKFRANNPDYASSDSDRENKMANDVLSPKEKIFFEISRNIDQHVGIQDYEDLHSQPKDTCDLQKCVSRPHKGCKTKNTPHPILSAEKNKNTKNSSRSSSASSNTSVDTVYASPNHREKVDYPATYSTRDSSVVSKYGMSSPNLSLATKLYLDKFGLVQHSEPSSPEDKIEKEFSRKLRIADCRRQLRQ